MELDWPSAVGLVCAPMAPLGLGVGVVALSSLSRGETWFARGCFILTAALAAVAFVLLTRGIPMDPLKLLGTGIAGAAILIGLTAGLEWIDKKQQKKDEPIAIIQNSSASFFLECTLGAMPSFPANGKIYYSALQPGSHEFGGFGLGYMFGTAGENPWPKDKFQWTYECRVTNDGTTPAVNVSIPVEVIFREAVSQAGQPNSFQSGKIISEKRGEILIPRIDPGRDNPFVFYMYSWNKNFADVAFGKTATINGTTLAPVTQSALMRVNFSPRVDN